MLFKYSGIKSANKSDEELISQFSSESNLEILGELYSRYIHLVYGVCLKYLKNREEAQDGVMQIFEKIITEIAKHRILNFKSWLYVVTKNYCLMQLRSARSDKGKRNEWYNDPSVFMESEAYLHPLDDDNRQEQIDEALNDCIKKLIEEQKNCIIQFYFENRCYNEIAVNLGLNVKKVKSHLQNGKRNLKICLEKKNETDKKKQ